MDSVIEQPFWRRLHRRLGGRPLGVIALMALLVSTQVLFQPLLFDMWELPDIALGWFEYFSELLTIGLLVWVAVTAVDLAPATGPWRRAALLGAALVLPVLAAVWLISWRFSGRWWPAAPLALLSETLKYSMLAGFVYATRALQRHAERADAEALGDQAAQHELERQAAEARLSLLQAQIEPHFLFNTLAHVRRLYRKHPAAGARAIDDLLAYLRVALPQVRRTESTLGDEFAVVAAYLRLFQVRMGPRLVFRLDLPATLRALPFPPMVLVTLAENAIKHGLAPAELGGCIEVAARIRDGRVEVAVADDGVGFGPDAGGCGVGLVNVRRQLAARFGAAASLVLEQRQSGGVIARLGLPMAAAARRGRPQTAAATPSG